MSDERPAERLAYTVALAAQALSVSQRTIWRMIQRGEIVPSRAFGRVLIKVDDLRALLDRREER